MEKVKNVLKELAAQQGTGQDSGIMKDLDFVTRWAKLEEEAKHKLYSKHACAELNIFIYFKDSQYF